jgi:hypothetical protein
MTTITAAAAVTTITAAAATIKMTMSIWNFFHFQR